MRNARSHGTPSLATPFRRPPERKPFALSQRLLDRKPQPNVKELGHAVEHEAVKRQGPLRRRQCEKEFGKADLANKVDQAPLGPPGVVKVDPQIPLALEVRPQAQVIHVLQDLVVLRVAVPKSGSVCVCVCMTACAWPYRSSFCLRFRRPGPQP